MGAAKDLSLSQFYPHFDRAAIRKDKTKALSIKEGTLRLMRSEILQRTNYLAQGRRVGPAA